MQPGLAVLEATARRCWGLGHGSPQTDVGFGVQKGNQESSGAKPRPGPGYSASSHLGRAEEDLGVEELSASCSPALGTRGRTAGISQRFRVGSLASPTMGTFSKWKPRPGLEQRLA